jgi:chlorophyllide a reductase subunit Z
MGYSGCVYLLQEIVNRLYETLFNFLPVDAAFSQMKNGANGGPPSGAQPGNMRWQSEAKARLDAALEKLPFLTRISASREYQRQAEGLAQAEEMGEVTIAVVEAVLEKQRS